MSDAEHESPELRPLPYPDLLDDQPAASEDEAPKPAASRSPGWQRVVWAIGAIVLYLLLIDAAVEAVLDASPIRWGVVGVVVGFLVLSALLWRKTGWAMKAGLAALVLLGLLTGATWYAGDANQSLMLVRQPPLTVLAVVTGLMVALAGLSLMQLRAPWWDRLFIGAVAIYGVAAFILPLVTDTVYPDLFREGGFWYQMPFWFQGGFIGVLVVIPATLLALLVTGIRRIRGKQLWRWGFKMAAFSLGLFLALMAFSEIVPAFPGQPSAASQQAVQPAPEPSGQPAPTPSTAPASLSANEAQTQFANLFDALEASRQDLPRDSFDPAAVVAGVGNDPEALFAWVHDNTVLVPYQGVLRGATGVLMDRMGNSLDRALLLHTLLTEAGHEARLAQGSLSAQQGQTLMETLPPLPDPADAASDADLNALIDTYAQRFNLDAGQFRQIAAENEQASRDLAEQAATRVREQAAALTGLVETPGAAAEQDERRLQLRALRDHWWVQVRTDADWIDLDPATPPGAPGEALTETRQTTQPEDLRDNLYHTVEVRVVAEVLNRGRLREHTLLRHKLTPSQLFGKRIALQHIPTQWPQHLSLYGGRDPDTRLKETVLAQTTWAPVLSVGKEYVEDRAISTDGTVRKVDDSLLETNTQVQRSSDAISNLGANAPSNDEQGHFTAEWIEYHVQAPGRQTERVRRQVFDLLGPAARANWAQATPWEVGEAMAFERGLALLGETEILPQVCWLSPEFVGNLNAESLLANRPILMKTRAPDTTFGFEQLNKMKPALGKPYGLALARRGWSARQQAVYLDRPNVLSFHKRLQSKSNGMLTSIQAFDIVANSVAVGPNAASDPLQTRLEQGVLDTNAEALLLTADCTDGTGFSPCSPVINTAAFFTKADQEAWATVRTPEELDTLGATLPPDVRARIEQALQEGNIVITPTAGIDVDNDVAYAWWTLDPQSGRTLGIGAQGWGATWAEYLVGYFNQLIGVVAYYQCGMACPADNPVLAASCVAACTSIAGYSQVSIIANFANLRWQATRMLFLSTAVIVLTITRP